MKYPKYEFSVQLVGERDQIKLIQSSDVHEQAVKTIGAINMVSQETMVCFALNSNNEIIHDFVVSVGTVNMTVVDPKLLFGKLLVTPGAVGFILAHNHPSGSLKPSKADDNLTQKVKEGAKLLDLILLDHLIVTNNGYYSYADEGTL